MRLRRQIFRKLQVLRKVLLVIGNEKKTNPSADKIMIICKVLNITPYELLQDTVQSVEELDYRVVTKGTKEYDLLIEMESLKKSQKERLLGYIEALK